MADPLSILRGQVEAAPILTAPQRRALEHVAANSGKLYGSQRDFPPAIVRKDVLHRLVWSMGLIDPPRVTPSRTYELTDAGRADLSSLLTGGV